MLKIFPESPSNLIIQIPPYELEIVKRVGQEVTENSFPYLLRVKSQSGTFLELDLKEPASKLLEDVLQAPNLWSIFLNSVLESSGTPPAED